MKISIPKAHCDGAALSDRNAAREQSSLLISSAAAVSLRDASALEPWAVPISGAEAGTAIAERSVLVVDEAPGVRAALVRALRRASLEILTARSADEAVAVLARRPVDAVIADQSLAKLSGVELLARIRHRHPQVKRVLLTGHRDLSILGEAINRAGVDFFLSKPWDESTLRSLVQGLLEEGGDDAAGSRAPLGHGSRGLGPSSPRPEGVSWEAIFDAIQAPILLLDEDHRVVRANRAARELPDVVIGGRRASCCSESEAGPGGCPLREALESGRPAIREQAALIEGEERVHVISCFPVASSGESLRSVVQMYRDVTKERSLQKELLRSEQLSAAGKLAAGVAHEIRNPLAAMMNAVSLLRASADRDSEERELIDIVLDESRRVNRIVGDALVFARPSRHERARAGIDELITSTVALVEKDPRFSDRVALLVEIDEDVPPVSVERDRIREVIWNLLLNAVQAVAGGGTVSIAARGESRAGMRGVVVEVDDSGPGIPEALRECVFAPFETTKPNGTGLGLSLAKHIVDSHGGAIEIEDADLGGARLRFWLQGCSEQG